MADITIIHRIEAPGVVEALNNLADALRGRPQAHITGGTEQQHAVQSVPAQVASAPVANPTPAPAPAPVMNGVSGAASVTTSAPTAAAPIPAPAAVLAPAPNVISKPVSFDVIVAAGSQLLEAGRMNDLTAVLGSFGVQALTQLKPEQYSDVAAALRGLGAQI